MAHTNHTANYELSQFVANDKPTFLGDYNGDMAKIDAAIKAADNKAGAADTTAESAAALATSASTTATEAATDAATAAATATTALNTANNATTTAQNASTAAQSATTTASAAATKADAAKTEAEAATAAVALKPSYDETFARMFTMASAACVFTPATGFAVQGNTVKVAKNTDVSLGKIYGVLSLTCTETSTAQLHQLGSFAAGFGTPNTAYNIDGLYGKIRISGADKDYPFEMRVNTDGSISLAVSLPAHVDFVQIPFPPCLYVLQDFGD